MATAPQGDNDAAGKKDDHGQQELWIGLGIVHWINTVPPLPNNDTQGVLKIRRKSTLNYI